MSKYINTDKFVIPKGTVDDIAKRGVIAIHDLLEIQPSADVAEVVRCKDCKHRFESNVYFPNDCCDLTYSAIKPTDYCSYGELE